MRKTPISNKRKVLLGFLAGAALPLSFSPFDFWIVAFISPPVLYLLTREGSVFGTVSIFYSFTLGTFLVGVHWIFFSIHDYGHASIFLSGFLVLLFVVLYSLMILPGGFIYARFFRGSDTLAMLAFISVWVISEWIRSWFLTGFPWLFLGYGAMGSWLVNFSPLLGVFGVSFISLYVSLNLLKLVQKKIDQHFFLAIFLLLLSPFLERWSFTNITGELSVSLLQGNVDQETKWRPENRRQIFKDYLDLSKSEQGRDLIVWPEASITYLRESISSELSVYGDSLNAKGTGLIFGIPSLTKDGEFQNTVLGIGKAEGSYKKRRLVPFGEFVPMENHLRGVISFFDLPMSRNIPGPSVQSPLAINGKNISSSICYEIAYPDLVRRADDDPAFILTVSNDTWFGSSIGPWQHLQLARMRALENERWLIRATNNGVTAVINSKGQVLASLPQFMTGVLRHDVEMRSGHTPFQSFGSWPILSIAFAVLIFCSSRIQKIKKSSGI